MTYRNTLDAAENAASRTASGWKSSESAFGRFDQLADSSFEASFAGALLVGGYAALDLGDSLAVAVLNYVSEALGVTL